MFSTVFKVQSSVQGFQILIFQFLNVFYRVQSSLQNFYFSISECYLQSLKIRALYRDFTFRSFNINYSSQSFNSRVFYRVFHRVQSSELFIKILLFDLLILLFFTEFQFQNSRQSSFQSFRF